MRKLKFRVWDKARKSFNHDLSYEIVFRMNFHENMPKIIIKGAMHPEIEHKDHEENFVIQQYVGHIDKNSVEIYEGDIVKTCPDHQQSILDEIFNEKWPGYERGEIIYFDGGFQVCQIQIGSTPFNTFVGFKEEKYPVGLEIIGNIFQNPELVKQYGRQENK